MNIKKIFQPKNNPGHEALEKLREDLTRQQQETEERLKRLHEPKGHEA